MTKQALFLNGVYEGVLEEIWTAQRNNPGRVFFLQPYSSERIKELAQNNPSTESPVPIYISTTKNLGKVCYVADIVGWENKQELTAERQDALNQQIKEYQPGEIELYLVSESGKRCVNLLSIINLRELPNPVHVSSLTNAKSGKPVKPRNRSGRWVYVLDDLPKWLAIEETTVKEKLDKELEKGVVESASLNDQTRQERLANAPRKPEQIQVVSWGFRRNPDVIIEVLKRANGRCERCDKDAPFLRAKDGSPYLEIHHWTPLAEGGDDTVENAGALCPNCHREAHFGQQIPSR